MESKDAVLKALKGAFSVFTQDLYALPEEAFDRHFGGKSRTVADIVHEVNLVNDHIGLTIRGETLFDWPEGWITAPDDQKSKTAVLAAFEKSSSKIVETIEAMSEAGMASKVVTEHGETD